jgi:hypothetical protein
MVSGLCDALLEQTIKPPHLNSVGAMARTLASNPYFDGGGAASVASASHNVGRSPLLGLCGDLKRWLTRSDRSLCEERGATLTSVEGSD